MSMCTHMSAHMSTSKYVYSEVDMPEYIRTYIHMYMCVYVSVSGGKMDIPVFLLQKVDFPPAA